MSLQRFLLALAAWADMPVVHPRRRDAGRIVRTSDAVRRQWLFDYKGIDWRTHGP
jgi:hypothetical protein